VSRATVSSVSPFLIVRNVSAAVSFYRDRLDFEVTFQQPQQDPFFGIVRRDGALIMLKHVGVHPLPNHMRHEWARWDAYFYVSEPDALAAEFSSRGVDFLEPLRDTEDNLRGFEIEDPDGYVLFFGRPVG